MKISGQLHNVHFQHAAFEQIGLVLENKVPERHARLVHNTEVRHFLGDTEMHQQFRNPDISVGMKLIAQIFDDRSGQMLAIRLFLDFLTFKIVSGENGDDQVNAAANELVMRSGLLGYFEKDLVDQVNDRLRVTFVLQRPALREPHAVANMLSLLVSVGKIRAECFFLLKILCQPGIESDHKQLTLPVFLKYRMLVGTKKNNALPGVIVQPAIETELAFTGSDKEYSIVIAQFPARFPDPGFALH